MNERIEKVLAILDGFRMSDEMTYSAYSALHDEISLLNDLLKDDKTIVRCKDCKYCEYRKAEKEWCKKGHLHGNAENWFCADGKRR